MASSDDAFVDLPLTTSQSDIEDIILASLKSSWPNFTPNEADPETTWIEAFAAGAQNVLQQALSMPKQALIALAVKLFNQAYQPGASAYTTLRLTFQDVNGPYVVQANSGFIIDGYGFLTVQDATCPNGATTADVLVASTVRTAAANGLVGASVEPMSLPGYVTGWSVLAPTYNGVDPQTDDDFVNQVSRDRLLTTRTLVVLLDLELAALDVPGIARARADQPSPGNATVTVLSPTGGVVASPIKTQLAAVYSQQIIGNGAVTIADPTFTTVNVAWTVNPETGYDLADLTNRINAALTSELSPLTHGVPSAGDPGAALTTWINDTTIYLNRLIQVIGGVTGVHRVGTVTINGTGADLALTGAVPLPQPGTFTGTFV